MDFISTHQIDWPVVMDRLVDRLMEQAQANASSNATAPSAPDPTQEQVHDDVVEATSFNTGNYCL